MDPTTAALAVAALAVLSGPITAWLTFRWTRLTERERWDREQEAERVRVEREDRNRRVLRGEEAARDILFLVDEAAIHLRQMDDNGGTDVKMDYRLMQPVYQRIRQQAEFLTDEDARQRILNVADNLYYTNVAQIQADLQLGQIGHVCAEAAHRVIHAYLQGQPMPKTGRMDRLQAFHDMGNAVLNDEFGADDPLAPPAGEPDD